MLLNYYLQALSKMETSNYETLAAQKLGSGFD